MYLCKFLTIFQLSSIIMKFSISICMRNVFIDLLKMLNSILVQTFNDFEVVIVDGASTNGTVAVISNYKKRFGEKIRWILKGMVACIKL